VTDNLRKSQATVVIGWRRREKMEVPPTVQQTWALVLRAEYTGCFQGKCARLWEKASLVWYIDITEHTGAEIELLRRYWPD